MTMTLVETVTLGTAAANVEFANIPQTGKDLLAVLNWDGTANGSFELDFQLNSTTNQMQRLWGNGGSTAGQANDQISVMDSDYPTTNTFHSLQVRVMNYALAQKHSFSVESTVEANSTSAFASYQVIGAGENSSTSAVTNLKFVAGYLNFSVNTTASLYIIS